ncbi:MAG: DNA polymerase III subunit beta [Acidimicrobiia bacterium]|nr:DNA polymerase III subunit beta [Acidimicrobiia bacterium]
MRIRAERDDLADVLGRASRAVSTRSALEILQGVLCTVSGKELTVTATDLELTIRTALTVEAMEEGSTVIPARLAAEAVRKMPPGAVSLASHDGEVEITGNGPRFALREFNAADFPQIEAPDETGGVTMDGDVFTSAIAQVGTAASLDEARPILTGIHFAAEGESLRMVATDSYRLAVRDLPGVAPQEGLVPVRALRELSKSIGAPKLTALIGERSASFHSDAGIMSARLIEGTFPNYRQLLPEAHEGRLVVSKDELLDAVARASLVAEDHIPLRLSLGSGGVDMAVQRQEVGGETEHINGEYEGPEITIAFNPRYLSDGLNALDDDRVVLEVQDEHKPGLLYGAGSQDFRYLLMPVRL